MATYYVDFENGNDGNDGLSYANRKKNTPAGAGAGDTVRYMASLTENSLGINATWTNKSSTITLASALNVLITDCETAWTASANVTCTADTTYFRVGSKSAKQAIAAAFTTGKAAYFDLGSAQDYSGYQGITFWIRVATGTLAASTLSIRLCSDTLGDTTVDTLVIPAISQVDSWVPVYIDKGSALGASIRTITLYADADPGTIDVYLDNISTVKAASGNDNLNLRSLVSKNTTDEYWWGLRSINGTDLQIDGTPYNDFGTNQRVGRGYYGTTESVTTYHRIPIFATLTTGSFQTLAGSGSAGSHITHSGGWNRTDMSTQTGETWVDGSCGKGIFLNYGARYYITVDKLNCVRYDQGHYMDSSTSGIVIIGTIRAGHCRTAGVQFRTGYLDSATDIAAYGGSSTLVGFTMAIKGTKIRSVSAGISGSVTSGFTYDTMAWAQVTTFDILNAAWIGFASAAAGTVASGLITTLTIKDCGSSGFVPSGDQFNNIRIKTMVSSSNGAIGANFASVAGTVIIDDLTCQNNSTYGIESSCKPRALVTIGKLTTSGNTSGAIHNNLNYGRVEILSSSMSEGTKVVSTGAATTMRGLLSMRNYNGTSGDHRNWWGGGQGEINSETSIRYTASGISWKISPKHAYVTQESPITFKLSEFAVKATGQVTLRLKMRRTNTGLSARLLVRAGQVGGVTNDVATSISAIADTWQEVEVLFTPTETGRVQAEVEAWGGTTYSLYIDDMVLMQA